MLNDAKRELRFLAVYIHNPDTSDCDLFCQNTLSNPEIVRYINNNFLFWACSSKSEEGRRTMKAVWPTRFPFMALLVLKENRYNLGNNWAAHGNQTKWIFRMTIVGRLEGNSEPDLLLQRLRTIVNEFEMNLIQARADRFEQSINR